jgi:putative peptidoglycan lipid II flippase
VVLSLPLFVPALRAGIRLRPTLRFDPGVARRVRTLAAAGLAGLLAQQVLVLVTLRVANSSGGTGAINVYQYVQAVYLLPYAVLAVPLATAAFPTLSSQFAAGDAGGYGRTLLRSTRLVVVVSVAGAAVLVAVAPAVGGLFAALDVGGAGLSSMPVALTAFAPGLVGFALIAHLGRALFASGHAAWAARSTVAGWLSAVVLSLVLVRVLDADGDVERTLVALGLASSLGMSVAGVALWVGAARIRVGSGSTSNQLRSSLPVVGAFLLVAVVALLAGRWVTDLVLEPGIAGALVAGVVGSVLAGGLLVVGLAVVDREDLRTLLRRGARAGEGGTRA